MFERRTVSLVGRLDDELASRVAIELMTLDAAGDGAVQLLVDSGSGSLDAALTLIDVVDLLGVPVHATCLGRAEGAAVAVLAVCARRVAAPHARMRLCEPESAFDGYAPGLASWSAQRQRRLRRYCERVATATRHPVADVEAAMREGRYLDAEEARRFGLVDAISRPVLGTARPGPDAAARPPGT
jgi:ATP-dependent Clp protease protease subunit